jgi:hypothetical protein
MLTDDSRMLTDNSLMLTDDSHMLTDDSRMLTDDSHAYGGAPFMLQVVQPQIALLFHISFAKNRLLIAMPHVRNARLDADYMRADLPFETLANHHFEPAHVWRLRLLALVGRMQH